MNDVPWCQSVDLLVLDITWDAIVDVILTVTPDNLWVTPLARLAKELASHYYSSTYRFGHYGLKEQDKPSKCGWCNSSNVKLVTCGGKAFFFMCLVASPLLFGDFVFRELYQHVVLVCGMQMHPKEKSQVCYGEVNWLTNCCTYMRLNKNQVCGFREQKKTPKF